MQNLQSWLARWFCQFAGLLNVTSQIMLMLSCEACMEIHVRPSYREGVSEYSAVEEEELFQRCWYLVVLFSTGSVGRFREKAILEG